MKFKKLKSGFMSKLNNKKARKELAKITDFRFIIGSKAYSQSSIENVLNWIKNDLSKGFFIEAYALTEQYIEIVLKYALFGYLYFPRMMTMKLETALRISKESKVLPEKLFNLYTDFKSTRNNLIHKSIFYPEKAKQLKNTNKVKKLPLEIIQESERFFNNRAEKVLEYFISQKSRKKDKNLFIRIWCHVLKNINDLKEKEIKKFIENSYDKICAKTTKTR